MFGVGKTTHLSALSNWVSGNDAPVVADESPFLNWSDWDAAQRDLFLLDHDLNIVFRGNISGGVPSSLEDWIIDLIDEISVDSGGDDCICPEIWDPVCGADGETYSNSCYADCEGVNYYMDGEMNNDNPCNPMECYQGEWLEIVIDCAEQMGVPCDGGLYVSPPEGVCCSTCVQYGDSNEDGVLNVLDVVVLVDSILNPNGDFSPISDCNGDGVLNVLDVVVLVDSILNP